LTRLNPLTNLRPILLFSFRLILGSLNWQPDIGSLQCRASG